MKFNSYSKMLTVCTSFFGVGLFLSIEFNIKQGYVYGVVRLSVFVANNLLVRVEREPLSHTKVFAV